MSRNERRIAAKKFKNLTDPNAKNAALYEAGMVHMRAGRYLDAQMCCQQALAVDPNHADSLHLLGLVSSHTKHYDVAINFIALAIRQEPKAEYLSSLGS